MIVKISGHDPIDIWRRRPVGTVSSALKVPLGRVEVATCVRLTVPPTLKSANTTTLSPGVKPTPLATTLSPGAAVDRDKCQASSRVRAAHGEGTSPPRSRSTAGGSGEGGRAKGGFPVFSVSSCTFLFLRYIGRVLRSADAPTGQHETHYDNIAVQ